MELVPIIQAMENRGVRLDVDKAYAKIQECETRRNDLHQEIYSEIQTDRVNLQSGKQLAKLLFETRGLKPKRFTKGRSEEHTYELQSLMRISYSVLCLKK